LHSRGRQRDLRLSREIKRLGRYDGLIIDDLGYLQQSRDDMEVVFTLLAERYERGSVLMTSNLPFSKWGAIFKDAMMTAAAIERYPNSDHRALKRYQPPIADMRLGVLHSSARQKS
jgi:DNA replication protein DnaC